MFITVAHKQKCLAKEAAKKLGSDAVQRSVISKAAMAASIAAQPSNVEPQQLAQKEVVLAALKQDLDTLHALTDVRKKIALKKEQLLPKWQPLIDQYRESGAQYPFEPLMRFVIWLLDAEQIDKAIDYADFAIAQQQPMPDGFSRSLDAFTAETIHDWAQRQFKAGHSAEPYLAQVIARIQTRQWLVNEPIILNKLYKLVGEFAEKNNNLEGAEIAYLKCVEVNPEKHGVKTKLAAVQKKLGK